MVTTRKIAARVSEPVAVCATAGAATLMGFEVMGASVASNPGSLCKTTGNVAVSHGNQRKVSLSSAPERCPRRAPLMAYDVGTLFGQLPPSVQMLTSPAMKTGDRF